MVESEVDTLGLNVIYTWNGLHYYLEVRVVTTLIAVTLRLHYTRDLASNTQQHYVIHSHGMAVLGI